MSAFVATNTSYLPKYGTKMFSKPNNILSANQHLSDGTALVVSFFHELLCPSPVAKHIISGRPNTNDTMNYSFSMSIAKESEVEGRYACALARLDEIAGLVHDWNGYGAEPFSNSLVNLVRGIIMRLPVEPEVFPTARKSIQLEYSQNGEYIEFEIFSLDRVEMYVEHSDDSYEERTIVSSEIIKEVGKFYGI